MSEVEGVARGKRASDVAFRIFWASRVVAVFSTSSAPVVITLSLLQIGDAATLALALTLQVVGQLVSLLVSGPAIDRSRERRRFLVVLQASIAAVWLGLMTSLWLESSGAVVVLAACIGVLGGLNGPATQSVLRALTAEADLKSRIANLRIALNSIAVVGPAAAGAAVGLFPSWAAAAALGLCHAVSAVTLSWLPRLPRAQSPKKGQESRRGIALLLVPWFAVPVVFAGLMNVAWAGFFQVTGPATFQRTAAEPEIEWGVVAASLTLGLVLGGLWFKRVTFRAPTRTPLLFIAPKALPVACIFLFPDVLVMAAAAFIAGFLLEAFAVNFYTQVQTRMPETNLGTAMSADAFIGLALLPVGYQLAALPSVEQSPGHWQLSAAGAIAVLAVVGWLLLVVLDRRRGA